ncbi:hypothetical protein ACN28E_21155 [Archangium lansingense]|uniref:hypothetical protein n=1 Tax=Archangium lansingense TaxID=2995310 RepID=UPI003B81FF31
MNTKPLKDSLPDEHLLQVEPRPRPSVETDWRSRPNLYTGRALSAEALAAEQRERSGHLALRGQMVAPGIVAGLEVRLEEEEAGAEQPPLHYLHISPGMGLTASGEDVVLNRLHRVPLRKIPAYWEGALGPVGFDLSVLYGLSDEKLAATHRKLQAAVLVLVPVVSRKDHTTDAGQAVELDPENAAFEDHRQVDGCALVFFAWPRNWELPGRGGTSEHTWRNRLAWEIFNHEQQRSPGQFAPWEEVGVPLALVGFEKPPEGEEDPDPTPPFFIDRAAVVRTGGAPRGRTPLLESRGSPLLWQARSLQFAEQLSSFSSAQLTSPSASSPFELLPPVGTLPKESIDLFTWQHRFFPASFILDAVPVPLEQLDAVAHASSSLAPLRASQPERVRVLVPVPEAHFEPHLLQEELLDPVFPQAISSALERLGEWRARRDDLRGKATPLKDALDGVKLEHQYPQVDPDAVLGEAPSTKTLDPKEEDYETKGGRVPEFDDLILGQTQGGNWTSPTALGFSAEQVSTATSEALDRFGVISRQEDSFLFTLFTKGTSTWKAWEQLDLVQPFIKEFRALWNGNEFVIAALVCEPKLPTPSTIPEETSSTTGSTTTTTKITTTTVITPLSGKEVFDVHIAIGRHSSSTGHWSWETTPRRQVSEVTAFTAVCWKQGFIDAFVATCTVTNTTITNVTTNATKTTNTDGSVTTVTTGTKKTTTAEDPVYDLLMFTWGDSLATQPAPMSLEEGKGKSIPNMVALSSEDPPSGDSTTPLATSGDKRIELLFLGITGPLQPKSKTETEELPPTTTRTPPPPPPQTGPSTTPTRPQTTTTTTTTTPPRTQPTTTTTTTPPRTQPTTTQPARTTTATTERTTATTTATPPTRTAATPTTITTTPIALAPMTLMRTLAAPPTTPPETLAETPPPQPKLYHLSGVHKGDDVSLNPRKFIEVLGIQGSLLSACWTLKKQEGSKWLRQFDVLVMGSAGLFHTWYNEGWSPSALQVGKSFGSALVVDSQRDGRVHAFWWTVDVGDDSSAPNTLNYRRYENNAWGSIKAVQQGVKMTLNGQPFGAVINATAQIELFLTSDIGLQHVRMVADKTNELLLQQGLKEIISQNEDLLGRVNDFISAGSSQLQADTQNVRQLMISGTTEASRLVVSPILGATMVQSPLAARSDIESYLTHFLRKRLDTVSGATAEPEQLDSVADAQETLEQATSTRRDLTARLIEFVKELKLDVTGMAVLGVAKVSPRTSAIEFFPANAAQAKNISRDNFPLENLVANPTLRDQVLDRISGEPDAIKNYFEPLIPPAPTTRWKTSDYFSISVHHLENTLVLLQELERRMDAPLSVLEQYKALRTKLEAALAALQKRLQVVDSEVAESRQDVTVGRALLAEEQARINAINQRRGDIFAKHVPFLVFQRPRESDLTRDTSSRLLDPGLGKDILPEVLASTAAAPPELLAYTELIRDSPLKWFSLAPQLLHGLDRLDLIHRTFEWAYSRAVQRRPVQLPIITGRTSPRYSQGLSQLLSVREELLTRGRLSYFQYYQPAVLYTRTWLELQQSAHEQLSLGDLIDTAQGRPEVSRNAAAELEHITKVAMGLYERFGEVLPAIRLQWAEQFSQYDGTVDLHDLSRLPRWGQIEITARREVQRLVDWLFQRVVHTQPDAVSLMSDLVRVCLLLASHAPVNELLSGHVSKPTTAKVGGTLELAVDPARVRVGMHVMIRSGSQTVQAVVEDLSSGVVRARVLSTSAATVNLLAKQTVHFSDPGRGTGTLLPYLGIRR